MWTEVLQDSFLDLFDSGHLDFATATSIRFSPDGFQRFYDGVGFLTWKKLRHHAADNTLVGELSFETVAPFTAGLQLSRDHSSFRCYWYEYAC